VRAAAAEALAALLGAVRERAARWPDFVFTAEYAACARRFGDVMGYVREHGHLPYLRPAAQVARGSGEREREDGERETERQRQRQRQRVGEEEGERERGGRRGALREGASQRPLLRLRLQQCGSTATSRACGPPRRRAGRVGRARAAVRERERKRGTEGQGARAAVGGECRCVQACVCLQRARARADVRDAVSRDAIDGTGGRDTVDGMRDVTQSTATRDVTQSAACWT
jgi:hypothetical protein